VEIGTDVAGIPWGCNLSGQGLHGVGLKILPTIKPGCKKCRIPGTVKPL